MTFNSYKPFKKRNLTIKYFLIFVFWMTSVLIFTNALNLVTGIENATQYIKNIILTSDWTASWNTWIILDWNTSWGRIWSELYCTLNFDRCVNIKWLVETWDISWFLETGDLETELSNYALISDLTNLATKTELSNYALTSDLTNLATKTELLNYTTIEDTEKINTDTTALFNTLNTIINNYENWATTLNTLFVWVDNITKQ